MRRGSPAGLPLLLCLVLALGSSAQVLNGECGSLRAKWRIGAAEQAGADGCSSGGGGGSSRS